MLIFAAVFLIFCVWCALYKYKNRYSSKSSAYLWQKSEIYYLKVFFVIQQSIHPSIHWQNTPPSVVLWLRFASAKPALSFFLQTRKNKKRLSPAAIIVDSAVIFPFSSAWIRTYGWFELHFVHVRIPWSKNNYNVSFVFKIWSCVTVPMNFLFESSNDQIMWLRHMTGAYIEMCGM
jgi:hypothetical protein